MSASSGVSTEERITARESVFTIGPALPSGKCWSFSPSNEKS
jgi:hypothetical protein